MLSIPDNVDEDALKKARSGVCLHITRLRASSTCKICVAIVFVLSVFIVLVRGMAWNKWRGSCAVGNASTKDHMCPLQRLSSQPQKQRRKQQNAVVDTKLAANGPICVCAVFEYFVPRYSCNHLQVWPCCLPELGSKFPIKDEQTAIVHSREARLPLSGNAEPIQFSNKAMHLEI